MATNTSLKNQLVSKSFFANKVLNTSTIQLEELPAVKDASSTSEVNIEDKLSLKLGYKAYVELALRTGQYRCLNVVEIYEGQLKLWNPVTEELEVDFQGRLGDKVIGYAGYFHMINGFRKCVYWPKENLEKAKKSLEKSDVSYKRIVIKDLLDNWGILDLQEKDKFKA